YDSEDQLRLFEFLKNWPESTINLDHELIRYMGVRAGDVILLKQGIWEHRHRFNGFILVRNPASVYASLGRYDRIRTGDNLYARLRNFIAPENHNRERLLRWMTDIDSDMTEMLSGLNELEQFCAFYNRRMLPLAKLELPVIHYERLVIDPEQVFKQLLDYMQLEYLDLIHNAHEQYGELTIGHGKTDLSRPIDDQSLQEYRSLGRGTFDAVCALTWPAWSRFGYRMNWEGIELA
ncbi:MAG: hypothetical protein MI673_06205, partial [Thiotrichales bacterium]|nr:hypothetical protein [Thiotrichales bacterium]